MLVAYQLMTSYCPRMADIPLHPSVLQSKFLLSDQADVINPLKIVIYVKKNIGIFLSIIMLVAY